MGDVDIRCGMGMRSGGKPRRRAHILGKPPGVYSAINGLG